MPPILRAFAQATCFQLLGVRMFFPGARLGNCQCHALNKLPKKLAASAYSPGVRTRKRAGIGCSQAPGCPWPAPC